MTETQNKFDKILDNLQSSVPNCGYHVNVSLGMLKDSLEQFSVNLDPEYQRGHVWTEEQQTIFMGSLLRAPRLIPPLWLRWVHKNHHRSHSELLDGKQRITAALRWLNNEIPAVFSDLSVFSTDTIWHKDLGPIGKRNLDNHVLFSWNFVDLVIKDTYKFYLLINSGGTKHTEEELEKVRQLLKSAK